MKLAVAIKKFKNPRVRKRLKIALSVYAVAIALGVTFKIVYDIGFFNAKAIESEKLAKRQAAPRVNPVLNKKEAQRIVSGALKENPNYPQTIVNRILSHDRDALSIEIETNQIKQVAWIIKKRLFFIGDLFDATGYNLTEAVERKNNINDAGY